jgi:hypothetical protein
VEAEEIRDRRRLPAAHAALGRDAERPAEHALGGLDPAAVALGAILGVDQTGVELCLRVDRKPAQRREIRLVGPVAGDGEVDPVDGTLDPGSDVARDIGELADVCGLLEVPAVSVAVAEVLADASWWPLSSWATTRS